MKIYILFIFLVLSTELFPQAYIKNESGKIRIGNSYIERVISLSVDNFGTTEIINKRSNKSYKVHSNEFGLQIVFSSVGPAIKKQQNGENPSYITARDFSFKEFKISETDSIKKISLDFELEGYQTSFLVTERYEIAAGDFYLRKYVDVKDTSYGIHFFDKIFIEDLTIENSNYSYGQFGQPVFDNDIFLGVEYPAAENLIDKNHLRIGYVVGQEIDKNLYSSHPSIIGASVSLEKLEQTFLDYIDRIKVNGNRPYLLYNSWYDFRNPAIAKDSASIMNEKNVLQRINTFKDYLYNKYDIALDAFVLDDGWDNYKSIWAIDTITLPNKFTPFTNALKPMNTTLGIWASPFGGYSNRDIRVNWAKENGFETVADFFCFAGTKYKAEFKRKMLDYTKKYNLGYFKWDGFLLSCNQPDHGHLPGVYSTKEYISTFIDMMQSVRKINPDIFINITVGTWLSPWWLKYANAVWMQGEDYAYAEEVPSINPRDKSITYRDAVLYEDFAKQNLIFPTSNLMTHGIIKGRLNFLGGKDESLHSFSNEVMMYFGRGVMMWELYVSPELLSNGEWEAIASAIKWAKDNKDVLTKTKMILGDPLKREPYGYIHFKKDKGILLLRNPDIDKNDVELKLDGSLGDIDPTKEYYLKVFYPYNFVFGKTIKLGQSIKIPVNSYEVLAGEFIPKYKIDKDLPINSNYEIIDGKLNIDVDKDFKGSIENIKLEKLISINSASSNPISFYENNVVKNLTNYSSTISIKIPEEFQNSRLAVLVEPDTNLIDEQEPNFEISLNNNPAKINIEQENGKWFWISTDLSQGENKADINIKLKGKVKYKISTWVFSEHLMRQIPIDNSNIKDEELLPAKPYAANIKKEIVKVSKYEIN